jgi:hypothetical protein
MSDFRKLTGIDTLVTEKNHRQAVNFSRTSVLTAELRGEPVTVFGDVFSSFP